MSYLAKPGAGIVHIYGGFRKDGSGRRLEALCPERFPDPHLVSYFPGRRDARRVCRHCARIARRKALALLADAEGRELAS